MDTARFSMRVAPKMLKYISQNNSMTRALNKKLSGIQVGWTPGEFEEEFSDSGLKSLFGKWVLFILVLEILK